MLTFLYPEQYLISMVALKYKVIKSKSQYWEYANLLEQLVFADHKTKEMKDEIELITLLIEKWDKDHNTFKDLDPIPLLLSFMEDGNMKAKDLAGILNVSKGLVSDILNYKKGLSKENIRILAAYFKVNQEAFNRPYSLK